MSMKRVTDKIRLLTLLALLIGCGEEELPYRYEDNATLLRLQSVHTGEAVPTRAGGGTTPLLDTTIPVGFCVQELRKGENVIYATQNNVKGGFVGSGDTGAWQPIPTDPIWLNSHRANLTVYAPYSASQVSASDGNGKLRLTADLYHADKDLVSAPFTANNQSTGLDVTLKHLYVRLTFTFVKDITYTDVATVDKIELTGADIHQTATYDQFAETGHYAIDPTATGITKTFAPGLIIGTVATAPDAAKVDLLLIPTGAAFTEDALLTITSGEKVLKVPISKSLFSGSRLFAAGKQYNFIVKTSLASIIIEESDLKTTDWEDADAKVEAGSEFD